MVYLIGRRIKRFINLVTYQPSAAPLMNMQNNILQQPGLIVSKKSDISTQCSISDDKVTTNDKSDDDCLTEEEEDCEINSDQIVSKRKLYNCKDYIKKPKKVKLDSTRPGFSDERFNETSYYFENGLRKVYPYYFTFTTYTKGRWVGKTLLEVFGNEFRAYSTEEYQRHIEAGTLTVNNKRISPDYVLKHNDLMANVVHRHEVPVVSNGIDIIYMDEDIVVVNKPASIPVHPCGRYRHNTIIYLLAKEYNLKDLKTIHRLDRLTSGVLMFGRTHNRARKLEAEIRDRIVTKQYVCRVEGKFPESIECNEPIEIVSYKIGVCKVSPKGKKCSTTFQSIGYNENMNTSVVICKPNSGRMHQIRVHLQYLGYPIKNDPLYNDTIFGPEKGRGGNFGKTDEQLVQDLIYSHNAENWVKADGEFPFVPVATDKASDSVEAVDTSINSLKLEQMKNCNTESKYNSISTQTGIDMPDMKFDKTKVSVDPYCPECKICYKDPEPKDLVMYLHAFRYSGPDWKYETPMPVWADINWKEP